MGLLLSLTAFAASWWCGQRSLGAGMAVVLSAGYFYGILRANFLDSFSFFVYDAAVSGLYLARFSLPGALAPRNAKHLTIWVKVLIGWPCLMFAFSAVFPQHVLIQLVGLRSAIWYLPFLLLGASARNEDLTLIVRTIAVLNLVTLAFGVGEYFLGLERFYPRNPVTELIYRCSDVAGYTAYRIPATFNTSAAYGMTMVATIPFLAGRYMMPKIAFLERWLFVLGLLATALGTFLCGSRMPVVLLFALGAYIAYHARNRMRHVFPALALVLVVYYVVSGSDRLQRFTTLQNTEMVEERIKVSVNVDIIDLVLEYPLGAGLGSAFGTNIPGFLQHLVEKPPIGAENEYARIGVEEGLVGMILWVGFLMWLFMRRRVQLSPEWKIGCKVIFVYSLLIWGTGLIGCGILASIPGTVLLLFQTGLIARDRPIFIPPRRPDPRNGGWTPPHGVVPPLPERENKPCLLPG